MTDLSRWIGSLDVGPFAFGPKGEPLTREEQLERMTEPELITRAVDRLPGAVNVMRNGEEEFRLRAVRVLRRLASIKEIREALTDLLTPDELDALEVAA